MNRYIMTLDLPDKEICDKYINGKSARELAKEYECGETTIRRRLNKYDITIRTLSESHIGRQTGKNHPMYGKKHTIETRKKMSTARKNRPPHSEETKRKMSGSHIGHEVSDETRKKLSESIVMHHYLYDGDNPLANTIPMTRYEHLRMHRFIRKAGIIIKRINQ